MNGILKVLTAILGVLAVIACLATIGIVGYSMTNNGNTTPNNHTNTNTNTNGNLVVQASAVPTMTPEADSSASPDEVPTPTPASIDVSNHVHDYQETVVKKATCYSAGQMKYTCLVCGDEYYVDIMSTGHVPDDWEVVRKPTATEEGLRVKKCIYCDEIVASEPIPVETTSGSNGAAAASPTPAHIHQYTVTTEREPSCVLAGLRRYSCSCGSFYTEMIPAPGHIASDWTTVASPSAHKHNYVSYVLKEANCTERGIRSFVCSCGSSYAEPIERDLNNHTYRAVVSPATNTTQGYTIYTCIRCNSSYYDNYTPPLDPAYANAIAASTASPSATAQTK